MSFTTDFMLDPPAEKSIPSSPTSYQLPSPPVRNAGYLTRVVAVIGKKILGSLPHYGLVDAFFDRNIEFVAGHEVFHVLQVQLQKLLCQRDIVEVVQREPMRSTLN